MAGKRMLCIALGTGKNIGASLAAEAAFAAGFHVMGFVFGHADILLLLSAVIHPAYIRKPNHLSLKNKGVTKVS